MMLLLKIRAGTENKQMENKGQEIIKLPASVISFIYFVNPILKKCKIQ